MRDPNYHPLWQGIPQEKSFRIQGVVTILSGSLAVETCWAQTSPLYRIMALKPYVYVPASAGQVAADLGAPWCVHDAVVESTVTPGSGQPPLTIPPRAAPKVRAHAVVVVAVATAVAS